jgi:hypothetical protein
LLRNVRACFLTLLCALSGFAPSAFAADSEHGVWAAMPEASISRTAAPRQIVPNSYLTLRLNRGALDALLAQAPMERDVPVQSSASTLSLPLPDGSYGEFRIVESPIMEPELAAKFPEIRTWLGQGIDDPTATARFDLTPAGFHGQILSSNGTVFIDPFQPGDIENYISYRKGEVSRDKPMVCGVTGEEIPADQDLPNDPKRGDAVNVSSGSQLRTYRLAMAATGEYTAFFGGTVAQGLAAVVTTINRVDGIYEREVAVRMVLVANNNLLIYTNPATDPYTNDDGFAMLGENQNNVDAVIGTGNYDFGHVVSTNGGGVAGLGVICSTSSKARGVTGTGAPVGDPFDVDYVAHEIGHQFGGNHTFNSNEGVGSCNGNRNPGTAYETGSGITIQAYAGICGVDNVQNHSVDYFHRASLNEILAHVTSGGGAACAAVTSNGNTPPVVVAPAAVTIPASTPFELTASGSDVDGDALTYLWEDYNLGPINPAGSLIDDGGPLFRNFSPVSSPSRMFPALTYILNNANVAPTSAWELLPTVTRSREFRVTVRDNHAGGGGTNEAFTTVSVTSTAGPFQVTVPNTAVSWMDGMNQTVSWNVANTTAAPVSTANVRIRLSTDGGNTWPTTLAASVPNNGSASVFVPTSVPATTQARIRVEAVGNIYFDVSDSNFTITDSPVNEPVLGISGSQVITGNNLIEPNECNQLNITLSNTGPVAATGVTATLSTSNPNVTVTEATASFPTIAAGGSQTSSTPFRLSTGGALVCLSNIDLTLTVTYTGGGSPFVGNLNLPVGETAVPGNYVFTTTSGATIPAGGVLVAGSQADDAVVNLAVPAGFNFSIYDTAVTGGSTLRVNTNGNLQIVGSGGSSGYTNGALPNAGNTDSGTGAFPASLPVLMPYWDDLVPNAVTGGGIYQQTTGSSPNRKWIIEWRAKRFNASGTAITTNFAIEFTEGSSSFAYLYGTVEDGGASATIGVQKATTGTELTQFSFNTAASVSSGLRLTAARPGGGGCTPGTGPCAIAGVTVTETAGNTAAVEGGTDTYSMVLNSQPSADVVISISPDAQVSRSPASLTFTSANWATPQNVTVTAVDDRTVEGTHSGTLTHSAAGGGYDAVSIAAVTTAITDNDSASYQFTAASSNVGEATASAIISVSTSFSTSGSGAIQLAAPISVPFTVNAGSSATGGGVDYTLASSSVAVPVDGTTQNISVAIVNDAVVETAETLVLDLGAETGGSAAQQAVVTAGAPATHTLTIIDNDSATVSALGAVEQEGNATNTMQFNLQLDVGTPSGFNVDYQTRDDTALAGSDYVAASGSVSFAGTAGESHNISIDILGDVVPEADERFFVDLTSNSSGVVVTPATVSGEIFNDDLIADLQVGLQRQPGEILPGGPISYQVVVQNLSSVVPVPSADFQFTASARHVGISWTCAASSGSSCPASGSGVPSHAISLGSNGSAIYSISATVDSGIGTGELLTGAASINVTAPYSDPVSANNSATVNTPLSTDIIFRDGFETP